MNHGKETCGNITWRLFRYRAGDRGEDGGLPCPVTTAAHGTAFELAGTGRASTAAFENAIRVLARMVADKE